MYTSLSFLLAYLSKSDSWCRNLPATHPLICELCATAKSKDEWSKCVCQVNHRFANFFYGTLRYLYVFEWYGHILLFQTPYCTTFTVDMTNNHLIIFWLRDSWKLFCAYAAPFLIICEWDFSTRYFCSDSCDGRECDCEWAPGVLINQCINPSAY
jgi:hypothetical protein